MICFKDSDVNEFSRKKSIGGYYVHNNQNNK
ncbi:hypothetical protein Niako_0607 [Niastella koreensis GR20-10]|uniref:Uncharacterized protein n=1 Tax=Niastella koreensis (strain DSM 17620 / KACC 11465 / NBRC 106392 / GR20-10) TaxID=700598 RepID=G8T942_NIAKG|nr:hypothetical protein Niako_0607 [Niastella koreensis GR20-10]